MGRTGQVLAAVTMMVFFSAGGAAFAATMDGTGGVDKLTGGAEDDTIQGLGGNDSWLNGGFGDDTVLGGTGGDDIRGSAPKGGHDNGDTGRDTLSGGAGSDYVLGGLGADKIRGGDGADYLFDDAGEFGTDRSVDTLSGGEGNDTILAANGKAARRRGLLRRRPRRRRGRQGRRGRLRLREGAPLATGDQSPVPGRRPQGRRPPLSPENALSRLGARRPARARHRRSPRGAGRVPSGSGDGRCRGPRPRR